MSVSLAHHGVATSSRGQPRGGARPGGSPMMMILLVVVFHSNSRGQRYGKRSQQSNREQFPRNFHCPLVDHNANGDPGTLGMRVWFNNNDRRSQSSFLLGVVRSRIRVIQKERRYLSRKSFSNFEFKIMPFFCVSVTNLFIRCAKHIYETDITILWHCLSEKRDYV